MTSPHDPGDINRFGSSITPLNKSRQRLFHDILVDFTNTARPGKSVPSATASNGLPFAPASFGNWGIGIVRTGHLRLVALLWPKRSPVLAQQLFEEFLAERERWQQETDVALTWEPRTEKNRCFIAAYYPPIDLDDAASVAAAREWGVATLIAMYGALNDPLTRRANELIRSTIHEELSITKPEETDPYDDPNAGRPSKY